MSDEQKLPEKRLVARELLVKGSVMVHLDPRNPDASVPPYLAKQPQLVLQIGLDLPVPIPDLLVDDFGVQATLSFNRTPHPCRIPWAAVFALVGEDGQGLVWPESFPTEIRHEVEREAGQRPAPGLRLVNDDSEPEVAGEPDETPSAKERPTLATDTRACVESKPRESKPALSLAPVAEEATDDGEGESDSSLPKSGG